MASERKYHVAASPIDGTIFAGRVNKDGDAWLDKSEATNEVVQALWQCMMIRDSESIVVKRGGKPVGKIVFIKEDDLKAFS